MGLKPRCEHLFGSKFRCREAESSWVQLFGKFLVQVLFTDRFSRYRYGICQEWVSSIFFR
ncbi:hypothetical protein BDQ17DRAFT_1354588, partial [Cyathus striatus]